MIYSLFLLYVQLKVNKNIKFKVLNTCFDPKLKPF